MYLKLKLSGSFISVVFFSCFKKFKCLGDVLDSVSLLSFATFEVTTTDFDPAQHFFCSVKTVERGQIFLLSCGQLRKKGQHNFI